MKSKEKKKNNDWTLKIFALLLAIFLWSYVMSEVNPEITRKYSSIELEFSNTESLAREGLEIMDPKEAKISVQVSGKKSDMANFSSDSIKAIVDLAGYTEGQKKVPVRVSLENMSNIKIIDYEPKEVLVTFDKLITKEKNVTIRTVGELASSYVLGDISTKTETILLKGPRSWINEISDVVAFVDLKGRTQDGIITTQVRLLNNEGNDVIGVEKEPPYIDVEIPILRSKEVQINVVTDKELPEEYEVKQMVINPNKVILKGDKSVLELQSISTEVLNIEELINNDEVKVKLNLPNGIELMDPNQEIKISLNVIESVEEKLNYLARDLEIRNLDSSLKAIYDLETPIEIIIKGDKEKINSVIKDSIILYLDLKDLNLGSNNVEIETELPNGITIKSISPRSINIELE